MNTHIKRWIDELVLSLDIGEEFFAMSIKEKLIETRGTTFVCDNAAIGWYLNRQKYVEPIKTSKGRKIYRRIKHEN
jgi:hypothetical protein